MNCLSLKITAVSTIFAFQAYSQFCFSPAASLTTGSRPFSIASADFNNDGNNDLAVVNNDACMGQTVSVMAGDGLGNFGAAVVFQAGSCPVSVTSADFNGDGNADLAIANNSAYTITLLSGTGTGSFAAPTTLTLTSAPYYITHADVNLDGHEDLVTANLYTSNLSVLLGVGNGTFGANTDFTAGQNPTCVTLADFNNDGNPDIAANNSLSGSVSILAGNGAGNYGPAVNITVGSYPASVTSADFNGDGDADIAVTNGDTTVTILIGNGDGSFASPASSQLQTASAVRILHADFNADGNEDLVMGAYQANLISVAAGNGAGIFAGVQEFPTGTSPRSMITGDFDNDTKPDIAVVNEYGNSVSVLLNCNTAGLNAPDAAFFTISPNPVNGSMTVHAGTPGSLFLKLTDMNGRVVLHQTVKDGDHVDVASLQAGIYTVIVQQGQTFSTQKLIVQ